MAGERTSWALLAVGVVAVGLWPLACQTPEDTDTGDGLDAARVQAVLDAVEPNVVTPHLTTYASALDELGAAVGAWVAGGERSGVYASFDAAMDAWQPLDVHRVAPAEGVDPLELRDNQYSWPVINPCRVDQVTASGEYADIDTLLVNGRGLDALEHVLFSGVDTICPSQVPPNSDGAWDAMDEDALDAARAAYAQAIVSQLEADLVVYHDTWESAAIPSLQALMDRVFGLETVIKDEKLGPPLGIVDCSGDDCIDRAEGMEGSDSTEWLVQNLIGFRALFTGGDGVGFDDLLADVGEQAVADELLALTDEAIEQARALDPNLKTAIRTDRDAAVALYETVDEVDEVLRADVVPLLMLQLPAEVGGDVD